MRGTEFNLTMVFQLLNIAIIIGIIYIIYFLAIKLPENLKERNELLKDVEKSLNEINKKIDNKL